MQYFMLNLISYRYTLEYISLFEILKKDKKCTWNQTIKLDNRLTINMHR